MPHTYQTYYVQSCIDTLSKQSLTEIADYCDATVNGLMASIQCLEDYDEKAKARNETVEHKDCLKMLSYYCRKAIELQTK